MRMLYFSREFCLKSILENAFECVILMVEVKRMVRTTIRDVARQAGVSITTVSKALNDYSDVNPETRKRIQEIADKLNYVPNAAGRTMGGKADTVIGLLINDLKPTDPSGAVYGILSGVYHACQDNGVEFILLATDTLQQKQQSLKVLCLKKQLSGLICSGFRTSDRYMEQLGDIDIPCAFIDMRTPDSRVLDITIDNARAARDAVTHLLHCGRRNIAMVNGSTVADVSLLRERGYRRAMEDAGLEVRPERVIYADFDDLMAYNKVWRLLQDDPEIDALFCASDLMAIGACRAAEDLGLAVGRDILVSGFDDIPIAKYLYGGLTTIRQNFYRMGYTAGRAIYDKIEGTDKAHMDDVMYELVVRGSARAN